MQLVGAEICIIFARDLIYHVHNAHEVPMQLFECRKAFFFMVLGAMQRKATKKHNEVM